MERPEGFDPARDNESRVGSVIAVAVVFATLSTIFTALRIFTRAKLLHMICADDWAIIVAQFISISVSVLTGVETRYALGRHMWSVPAEDVLMQIKILYGVILGYNLGLNVVKISFLLFYLRIFQSSFIRRLSAWFLAAVALWTVTQVILLALTCMPLTFIAPSMEGRCLNTYPVWLASSITSTVTDFVIFTLPLRTVAKLKLRPRQKVVTILMFSLGFFTCIISILRIFTLSDAVNATDPTWDNVGTGCWSIVELNCAILCSNLPTLRPLVVKYLPSFGLSSAHASVGSNSTYGRFGRDGEYIRGGKDSRHGTAVVATRTRGPPSSKVATTSDFVLDPEEDTAPICADGTEGFEMVETTCYSGPREGADGGDGRGDGAGVNGDDPSLEPGPRNGILVTRETNIITNPAPALVKQDQKAAVPEEKA